MNLVQPINIFDIYGGKDKRRLEQFECCHIHVFFKKLDFV